MIIHVHVGELERGIVSGKGSFRYCRDLPRLLCPHLFSWTSLVDVVQARATCRVLRARISLRCKIHTPWLFTMRAGHSWKAANAFHHFQTLLHLAQCPEAHVGTDCLQNKDGWSCVCSMADALG